jgi:hypothetical protein
MSALTLRIDRLDDSGWLGHWSLDDSPLDPPILLTGKEAEEVAALRAQFDSLFSLDQAQIPKDAGSLQEIGAKLFQRWCRPVWETVLPRLNAGPREVLLRSTSPDALNLPWELVELSSGLPLGCDAGWSLRRTPRERLLSDDGPLPPGPLRILFLAAAP